MPHRIIIVGTLAVDGCTGCYIWYSEDWSGRGRSPPRPLLAVPNVTAPSTASVPITVLLYIGPLICGFNMPIRANFKIRNIRNIYLTWWS